MTPSDKAVQRFLQEHIAQTGVGATSKNTELATHCQALFKKYLESILDHRTNKSASQQVGTGPSPEETFMITIEAGLNFTAKQAEKFRSEVIAAICAFMQEHKTLKVPYSAYEPLAQAIEHYACGIVTTDAHILTFSKATCH